MPSRKRVFMVTRRGGLPPDHTKSPARGERARKAGENDVSAGAVIGRASGDTSGIELGRDAVGCCNCREITYNCNIFDGIWDFKPLVEWAQTVES